MGVGKISILIVSASVCQPTSSSCAACCMYSVVGKQTQMLAFFSRLCFSLLSVSPVWLPSRLLCSAVQFKMWLSFHIHFHSLSKSALLIVSMCIHSHNAEAEKWTANWKHSILSLSSMYLRLQIRHFAIILLYFLINHNFIYIYISILKNGCHCSVLYICQQLKMYK